MCVLCDKENLRLLAAPLSTLDRRQLADAIAIAREAAWQLVLDTADAISEGDAIEAPPSIEPEGYFGYVVERAATDGALRHSEMLEWRSSLRDETIYRDPRVQAFLSASAEGLATYVLRIHEHKRALEQFLEDREGGVVFAGVGANAEIVFERAGDRYVVLSDDEALRIAIDRIGQRLTSEDPRLLLEYTNLPDGAADVLSAMQQGQSDRANEILAGIIDLEAFADDRVRQTGYAPYVAEGITDDFTEQRFGDRIIVRLHLPEDQPPVD